MTIYFGADHRGFELKNAILKHLSDQGYLVRDLGAHEKVPDDDYVDFAAEVARKVGGEDGSRGILVCGSGAGMEIAANKFRRVRAAAGWSPDQVFDARNHDDINILTIASNFVSEESAKNLVKVFLETPLNPEERYSRRLQKIQQLEDGN